MSRRVVILGSTGSIGCNALRVCSALPDALRPVGLSAFHQWEPLLRQAVQWGVRYVALSDEDAARKCAEAAPAGLEVFGGEDATTRLVQTVASDIVLCSVVGIAGLRPVLAAFDKGLDVALATKEVLVAGGELVVDAALRSGVQLLPVDSEHSALFQCLLGHERDTVRRLVLTASGGPFHDRPGLDLADVTVAEALAHPSWRMGPKVTVDSATMMNKGLEMIEAMRFFGVPAAAIDVRIHPQSVVHSMVEFVDGSMLAQMSVPDMRFAIQYALTYPSRRDGGLPCLGVESMRALTFSEPDEKRFPALVLARAAGETGGSLPAVMNAANEVAVSAFLAERLKFTEITQCVEAVMNAHNSIASPGLDDIIASDRWARAQAAERCA